MSFIQNRYYSNKYSQSNYSPKKPVKSFIDLEVYQKALEASVFVANEIVKSPSKAPGHNVGVQPGRQKTQKAQSVKNEPTLEIYLKDLIVKNMLPMALSVPHLIAESHSKRFGESTECLKILDEVMLRCNKMVVYLEQARDILDTQVEFERFKEQIDKYQFIRRKVLNLQRVWRKYIMENKGN